MSLLALIATPTPDATGPTPGGQVPGPLPAPSPTTVPTTADALSWGEGLALAGLLMLGLLITGLILLWNRRRSPGDSLVRSWLAISFTFGLLLFTAIAMTLQDATLRSTLIGAVAASVGAAVSHYFASKASGEARQDLLAATAGTEGVPDLVGLTPALVRQVMSTTSLKLEDASAVETASASDVVATQDPPAGTVIGRGGGVRVEFTGPSRRTPTGGNGGGPQPG
jgi:hypothetical protein